MNTNFTINDFIAKCRDGNIFQKYGLNKIGIYGSFARNENFNDIDIYVEEDLEYRKIFDLQNELTELVGCPIDIMQKKYAEPVILYRALKDMKYAKAN